MTKNGSGFRVRLENILRDRRLLVVLVVGFPLLLIGLWIAFDLTVGISLLVFGMAVLILSATKAVDHSISIASALRFPPIMIGLIVVAMGTDFPEIVNSLVSSSLGHGDINVGDSLGSVLTQMTLVLGILALIGRQIKVDRNEVATLGAAEILALIAALAMFEKGYITWMNAAFLVVSWPILLLLTRSIAKGSSITSSRPNRRLSYHLTVAILAFVCVAVGSYIVIQSVIVMSAVLHIQEYFISFFVVAIGTSLPELAVDLTAIRKKQYGIAIGDVIGSSIIDAGFSIGIGALFFSPLTLTSRFTEITGLYALFASFVVLVTLAWRRKLDIKAGLLFIILYAVPYLTLFI